MTNARHVVSNGVGGLDKQEIFKRVAQVEEQIGELYQELGGLKERIVELIEENTQLLMENQRLRELHETKVTTGPERVPAKEEQTRPESLNKGVHHLVGLYDEGFHICNVHYGRLRTEGECLFCIAFLNKSTRED
jgi:regulator of replication initiation timing